MERRHAAVFERPGIQFAFDRLGVIHNLQERSAGKLAQIFWMLWVRRVMQKFRGITFDDSIDIVHAKLMLIDQQSIGRRLAFKKRDRPFHPKNPADERTD